MTMIQYRVTRTNTIRLGKQKICQVTDKKDAEKLIAILNKHLEAQEKWKANVAYKMGNQLYFTTNKSDEWCVSSKVILSTPSQVLVTLKNGTTKTVTVREYTGNKDGRYLYKFRKPASRRNDSVMEDDDIVDEDDGSDPDGDWCSFGDTQDFGFGWP